VPIYLVQDGGRAKPSDKYRSDTTDGIYAESRSLCVDAIFLLPYRRRAFESGAQKRREKSEN
jgi:hypothetical protein